GLSGLDNKPTYYTITTKVGVKLLIVIPFLGDMGISGLTRDLTADIKREGGNEVRIVEGSSEAYFYGFPPFTWIVTPVISTVSAEYLPEAEQYEKDQIEADKNRKEGWSDRWYKPWRWWSQKFHHQDTKTPRKRNDIVSWCLGVLVVKREIIPSNPSRDA